MTSGLATRCPACGTVFRVVLDQLRVSEGWVRCGRCSDVFNAAETLVDLESGVSRQLVFDPPASGTQTKPVVQMHDTVADVEETSVVDGDGRNVGHDDPVEAPAATPAAPSPTAPSSVVPSALAAPPAPKATQPADQAEADAPQAPEETSAARPSFLRRAEREQRWRQPRVRAALAAVGVASVLGLAAQAAHEYRDSIAAQVPAARAALTWACRSLGCSIGAPLAIETISVESSGLVRVEKTSLYRLAVALRNRASFDVAVPAVELAVTDGQGKLIARRVLRPAEMGVSQPKLDAGRDLLLQATLQLATEPVAGYTIELFYP